MDVESEVAAPQQAVRYCSSVSEVFPFHPLRPAGQVGAAPHFRSFGQPPLAREYRLLIKELADAAAPAARRQTTPPVEIAEMLDCEVSAPGVIHTAAGILTDTRFIPGYVGRRIHQRHIARPPERRLRKVDRALICVTNGQAVYGHWLLDSLPRMFVARVLAGSQYASLPVLIPEQTPAYALTIIAELFGAVRFVRFKPKSQLVQIGTAVIPSLLHADYRLSPVYNEFVDYCVERATTHMTPTPALRGRKLFLRRRDGHGLVASGRVLVNERELEAIAVAAGYESLCCEDLPWLEQVALMSQASIVAGPSGSALHNAVFMPKRRACVISLGWQNAVQYRIAELREGAWLLVNAEEPPHLASGAYSVDAGKFAEALASAEAWINGGGALTAEG